MRRVRNSDQLRDRILGIRSSHGDDNDIFPHGDDYILKRSLAFPFDINRFFLVSRLVTTFAGQTTSDNAVDRYSLVYVHVKAPVKLRISRS